MRRRARIRAACRRRAGAWFTPAAPDWSSAARIDDSPSTALTFGTALIPILFAYGGWQVANYVAEEMRDPDKQRVLPVAKELLRRGFSLVATAGTAEFLNAHGAPCDRINKVLEGRPHVVDLIKNGEIVFIVNTTEGKAAIADSFSIRREALQSRITYSTTVAGAWALVHSLDFHATGRVTSLQELHRSLATA